MSKKCKEEEDYSEGRAVVSDCGSSMLQERRE